MQGFGRVYQELLEGYKNIRESSTKLIEGYMNLIEEYA